jgi:hypothetical protein
MTEEANPTPPMPNSPEARTETGEIKDAGVVDSALQNENGSDAASASKTTEAQGAPESYSDFVAPEGVTLDPKLIEAATPVFKELGLSQEAAQKLVDFHAKHSAETETRLLKTVDDMRAKWQSEVRADKDLANLDAVKAELGRAKDKLPADVRTAFDEAMNLTGMGDHPAIVKGLFKLAQLVNEGRPVIGSGPSPEGQTKSGQTARPTLAAAMYPNLPQ